MTLSQKQAKFAEKIAHLILYIEDQGYHVTFGDAARMDKNGHRKNSFHYTRLAIDLNLFDPEWHYLTNTEDHEPFGAYWESIGGTWGGRFDDGNHYSWGEN